VTAVWFRARAQLRERWRAWLALASLIGVASGVVFAAAAGARRTESAYPRFEEAQRGLSFIVSPDEKVGVPFLERVRHFPEVIESTSVWLVPGTIVAPHARLGFPDIFPLVDPANRFGITINRWKILSGQAPDPDRPDEVVVSSPIAAKLGVGPGSRVRFDVLSENDQGEVGDRTVLSVPLKVVGVEIAPGELQALSAQSIPALHLTPAFARVHPDLLYPTEASVVVRTHPGVTQADLRKRIEANGLRELNVLYSGAEQESAVQRSSHFQGVALWVIAGLTAVTAIGIFGQALARQASWESTEDPVLMAVGMSRTQLLASALVRAVVIGTLAGLIGLVVGVALSPLTPVGIVRPLEPSPGVHFDWFVLGVGGAVTLGLVALLTEIPAWRSAVLAARGRGNIGSRAEKQASRAGIAMAGTGLPPTAVLGVRMAIEPGRGRTSVPVRTTILGTTIGIVALIAAFTFSASLDRLVNTPKLYGWNWDALAGPEGTPDSASLARAESSLKADPVIGAFANGTLIDVRVGAIGTFALASTPVKGDVGFAVIEGRGPVAADEVALGSETLRKAGAKLGERIPVRAVFPGGVRERSMRVVGRVAMPTFFFTGNQPGEGVAMSLGGAKAFSPQVLGDAFFIRFVPSIAFKTGLAHLTDLGFFVLPRRDSQDLADLRRVSNVPLVLAVILTAMAVAMLVHTLLTSIRRRQRDLAILKTLGFVRRQVGAAIAWQASTLAVISLAIGIPVGIAAGRWAWRLFSDQLGVVPSSAVSMSVLILMAPATVLLANAIALYPGRLAARMRPAVVLRSE